VAGLSGIMPGPRTRDKRIAAPRRGALFHAENGGRFGELYRGVGLEVCHCRCGRDGWLLGCKFTPPQPWATVLLFG